MSILECLVSCLLKPCNFVHLLWSGWTFVSHLCPSWEHNLFSKETVIQLCKMKEKKNPQINETTWTQQLRIKLQTLFIDLSTTVMQITVAQECSMCCLQYDSWNTNCTEQQPSSTVRYAYKQTYKTSTHFYRETQRELSHRWVGNTGTPPRNAGL